MLAFQYHFSPAGESGVIFLANTHVRTRKVRYSFCPIRKAFHKLSSQQSLLSNVPAENHEFRGGFPP